MWCGPNAIAHCTDWTRDQVWLHCRWWREQRGHRLPDRPRGGTTFMELRDAAFRAGYRLVPAWEGKRRMSFEQFRREFGHTGRWLLLQSGHWWGYRSTDDVPSRNYNPILSAWRYEKHAATQ